MGGLCHAKEVFAKNNSRSCSRGMDLFLGFFNFKVSIVFSFVLICQASTVPAISLFSGCGGLELAVNELRA